MNLFGYFDSPEQTTPAYDPGVEIDCPLCSKPLDLSNMVTISLMRQDRIDNRSYFYRLHKTCREWATDDEILDIESMVIDQPDRIADEKILSTSQLDTGEKQCSY